MKIMAISRFKARALKIIDDVSQTREGVIITRRGKPLVQVLPYQTPSDRNHPGKLADTLVFEKDIVSPLDEEIWESTR